MTKKKYFYEKVDPVKISTNICSYCYTTINPVVSFLSYYLITNNPQNNYIYTKAKQVNVSEAILCNACGWFVLIDPNTKETKLKRIKNIEIKNLNKEDNIYRLWNQIQDAWNYKMYESVGLLSRILLAHIAVAEGAKENETFANYVKYIYEKRLLSRGLEKQIDKIRLFGNAVNHTLDLFTSKNKENVKLESKITHIIVEDVLNHLYKHKHLKKNFEGEKHE